MKCHGRTRLGCKEAPPHSFSFSWSAITSTRVNHTTHGTAIASALTLARVQKHPHGSHSRAATLVCPSGLLDSAPTSGVVSPATETVLPPLDGRPTPLLLHAGASVLPHPSKVLKGGEDWYFISGSQRAVGVADGVGGWAGVGIDAGAYARRLMLNACAVADEQASSADMSCSDRDDCEALYHGGQEPDVRVKLSAQQILDGAYAMTTVRGSSTVCIAALNGTSLQASNLGDSGLLILREGTPDGVLVATAQQQHSFNFPYQVGGDRKGDQPHQAERYEVEVKAGDILVMATDGLWDNCYCDEIVRVIRHCRQEGFSPRKAARTLAVYARRRAMDRTYLSPFAQVARKAGIPFMGGKMDDITVLLAYVEPAGANVHTFDESDLQTGEGEAEASGSQGGDEPGWGDEEKAHATFENPR